MEGYYELKGTGIDITNTIGIENPEVVYCPLCKHQDKIVGFDAEAVGLIVTSTKFLDGIEEQIEIFKEITNTCMNVILVSSYCDFEKYTETLENLKEKYNGIEIGIMVEDDCTKERLEEINETVGYISGFRYYGMKINPGFFKSDIVDFIYSYSGQIVGFDCLGSKNMKNYMIESFSKPYLIEFASYYCAVLIFSGEDTQITDIRYANSLINRVAREENLYSLKININSEYPKLNKMFSMTVDFDGDKIIVPNLNGVLPIPESIEFSFGNTAKEELSDEKKQSSNEDMSLMRDFLDSVEKPEDDVDNEGYFNKLRHEVITYFKSKCKKDSKKFVMGDCFYLSDNVYFFSIKEKKLVQRYYLVPNKYDFVPITYLLALDKDGNYLLRKVS